MKKLNFLVIIFLLFCGQQTFAGTPVPGKIVKGGKGPSCACKVIGTTNDKGEVEWKINESGNYIIQVEEAGIIIKASKGDGRFIVIAVAKVKGDIEWKNVSPGNYVLRLEYNDDKTLTKKKVISNLNVKTEATLDNSTETKTVEKAQAKRKEEQ